LDYIQGMGFTAIWITPITAQMEGNTADGSAYHGYWQQDMWVAWEQVHFDKRLTISQLWSELWIWNGRWSALSHFSPSRPKHVHDGRRCCQSHGSWLYHSRCFLRISDL